MSCYPMMSLGFFWGTCSSAGSLLLALACITDLASYYIRAAVFIADTRWTTPFSISEVLAYHQCEMVLHGLWPVPRRKDPSVRYAATAPPETPQSEQLPDRSTTGDVALHETAQPQDVEQPVEQSIETKVWRSRLTLRTRRRIQLALWGYNLVFMSLWWSTFVVRRFMWGFHIFGSLVGVSFLGLFVFPLHEDPAKRRFGSMVGHYACAVGVFVGFAAMLVGGHGVCTVWPLLPFGLCTALAAVGGMLGHMEVVESRPRFVAPAVHLLCTLGEWAALSIFYAAIMLPPVY